MEALAHKGVDEKKSSDFSTFIKGLPTESLFFSVFLGEWQVLKRCCKFRKIMDCMKKNDQCKKMGSW